MIWSKLCWDLSWEEKIKISDLLPKVNHLYQIELDKWNEDYAKEGKAFFLWQPPHSELNGWFDKRPSEIFKSYVLEGILKNPSLDNCKFDFYLEQITPLTQIFDKVDRTEESPLPTMGLIGGTSCIIWEKSRQLFRAQVEDYIYLAGFECETTLEAIFSLENGNLYLHYSAYLPTPAQYETVITKYRLSKKEDRIFKTIINQAEIIQEPEVKDLLENEVRGAEYW